MATSLQAIYLNERHNSVRYLLIPSDRTSHEVVSASPPQIGDEVLQTAQSLHQLLACGRIRQPNVGASRGRAEVQSRRQGHMSFDEGPFAEGPRIQAGGADVEVDVERAIGRHGNIQTEEMMQQTIEAQNYPPSLKGLGRVNPTQDFVDAFPAANGYPITHPLSGYNPEEPYLNRDPRLDSIVIRDESVFAGKKIHTYKDSSEDGIESSGATRTGYYLKKLLRQDVSIVDPVMGKKNCRPLMRTTEMYLIFAEAQTASKGPDAEIEVAFSPQSPRSVVKRIRRRSGIPKADPYASTVGQEEFMDLLRNERRIELAFEGFRFLDLRRWQMEVNGTVKRIRILPGKTPEILPITEKPRNYTRFKYFAPLPQAELQKCKLLEQKL